mmetsp:Transcript_11383/g.21675  ORF Transcript_11383/g.21675 Transcript_11383/m.21675 type:complete len:834 (-) Transcript_11383:166-2667(-)|eukprot:CAMPEP_0175146866 /NCGR_PEP_ID=MMETSP0087-20121206/15636_1 /TAXON_ID=136419 /ORGANISM="Unknown Unknown, Strain D1" /LENGTH=833 /DNA_ID=CAMNT_0016431915 /DNA_START=22 /DNA_END=2523 /DNA_ORIENTATION=+
MAPTQTEEKVVTFQNVDWTKKDEVLKLFPVCFQEKLRLEGDKGVSNTVDIAPFTLETPFRDKTLLKNTHLFLEPYKRHCLFGSNGTGKTLLFERMSGYQGEGIKGFPKHLHVHHCKEMEHTEKADTVFNTVLQANELLMVTRKCHTELQKVIAECKDDAQLSALNPTILMIEQYMRSTNSEFAEEEVKKMLRALGFDEFGMARNLNDLSGGLRMRVALAIAFFSDADLLLLDEPTNHLDFPSVLWLENKLRGYSKSFLLVTHDRDLLCNVTTSVLLLEDDQIKYYPCGFGEFEKRKLKEDEKKNVDAERFLKLNSKADPSTMTGKRVADLKKWQDKFTQRKIQMAGKFTFPKPTTLPTVEGERKNEETGATTLLQLEDVRFSYDADKGLPFIFDDPINFKVTTQSRIGIMGPNGAGKSTLLKLLTKKIQATAGNVYTHPNFVLAYFGQHSTAELKMHMTPMEFMMEQFPDAKSGSLRQHLAKTSIQNGVESTRMQNLSYSQRSCVIFSKLTYVCPHLLIMDEPTNFLDIDSVDALIAAANKFPGALLVVTHARHFLRKCAKSFLSVVPGQFLTFKDMVKAEHATYTFMQEMESGVKIDASQMSAGGGSLHAKKEKEIETKFVVGEKVTAMWTDKKFYEATVVSIVSATPPVKYSLSYPEFGKKATIPEAGVRKIDLEAIKAAEKSKEDAIAAKKQAAANALKKARNHVWAAGERCLSGSKDGRLYAAKVVEVLPFDMLIIKFDSDPNKAVKLNKAKVQLYDALLETKGTINAKPGGNRKGPGGKGAGGKGAGGKGPKNGAQTNKGPGGRTAGARGGAQTNKGPRQAAAGGARR